MDSVALEAFHTSSASTPGQTDPTGPTMTQSRDGAGSPAMLPLIRSGERAGPGMPLRWPTADQPPLTNPFTNSATASGCSTWTMCAASGTRRRVALGRTSMKLSAYASGPMAKLGRPRSLSEIDLERVLQLRRAGLGYRAISRRLWEAGVATSPWSVRRAILGLSPYSTDSG